MTEKKMEKPVMKRVPGAPTERGKKTKTFNLALGRINAEIKKYDRSVKRRGKPRYVRKEHLNEVFHRDRGRCRMCGLRLGIEGAISYYVAFSFFVPLTNGGSILPYNLILICTDCKKHRRPPPATDLLVRIPDHNTIADLIEKVAAETCRMEKGIGSKIKLRAFKRQLNTIIEESLDMLCYRCVDDTHYKEEHPRFIEDQNTIADQVEGIADATNHAEDTTDKKEQLANDVEGMLIEQRYRILTPE